MGVCVQPLTPPGRVVAKILCRSRSVGPHSNYGPRCESFMTNEFMVFDLFERFIRLSIPRPRSFISSRRTADPQMRTYFVTLSRSSFFRTVLLRHADAPTEKCRPLFTRLGAGLLSCASEVDSCREIGTVFAAADTGPTCECAGSGVRNALRRRICCERRPRLRVHSERPDSFGPTDASNSGARCTTVVIDSESIIVSSTDRTRCVSGKSIAIVPFVTTVVRVMSKEFVNLNGGAAVPIDTPVQTAVGNSWLLTAPDADTLHEPRGADAGTGVNRWTSL
jgi:hypothetical protein